MKQPIVAFFGGNFGPELRKTIEENTTPYFFDGTNILDNLKKTQPDVIVTVGQNFTQFSDLCNLDLKERKKWIHYTNADEIPGKLEQLYYCFINHAVEYFRDPDMITVFTTSYKSGKFIQRPLNTLLKQTYRNWEWIIFDDTDGDENWQNLNQVASIDPRIRIYKTNGNSGIIGNVKNIASSMARGEYLIELDHDDELTPDALKWVAEAFKQYPDAGMAYTDFTEIYEDGRNFAYSELFAIGYGAYRKEFHDGHWRNVCCTPPINPATIRYIVACPNHLRAWRRSVFEKIGGWNHRLHVADDFEIMIRTFLHSRIVRIPYLGYYQYRNAGGNNFTFIRNREIQKLVKVIAKYYNNQIHDRSIELNIKDPYKMTWSDWSQFGKTWLYPQYDERVSYLSHLDPDLASIVITCNSKANKEILQKSVVYALAQKYAKKEVIVIGVKCDFMEEAIGHIHNKELKWWNLQEGDLIDATNYACKMIVTGAVVVYWAVTSMHPPTYLPAIMSQFKKDPAMVWTSNKAGHRSSVFPKVGFWRKDGSLYDIYHELVEKVVETNEKIEEIIEETETLGPVVVNIGIIPENEESVAEITEHETHEIHEVPELEDVPEIHEVPGLEDVPEIPQLEDI